MTCLKKNVLAVLLYFCLFSKTKSCFGVEWKITATPKKYQNCISNTFAANAGLKFEYAGHLVQREAYICFNKSWNPDFMNYHETLKKSRLWENRMQKNRWFLSKKHQTNRPILRHADWLLTFNRILWKQGPLKRPTRPGPTGCPLPEGDIFWHIFENFDTFWLIGRLIARVILSIKFEGRDENNESI